MIKQDEQIQPEVIPHEDITHQIVETILHRISNKTLGGEWNVHRDEEAGILVVVHPQFLEIQNEFNRLEGNFHEEFNGIRAQEIIIGGLVERKKAQERQDEVYDLAKSKLSNTEHEQLITQEANFRLAFQPRTIRPLICIPSHKDAWSYIASRMFTTALRVKDLPNFEILKRELKYALFFRDFVDACIVDLEELKRQF